ncbi:MAG: LamG domain-containing protein [Kiritimatiellaeota bacterium]|nr:LamG domain-containing protein [Kiritimatiellota bacterium]
MKRTAARVAEAVVVLAVAGIAMAARTPLPGTAPGPGSGRTAADLFGIPPTWEGRVIFYAGFEGRDGKPELNLAGLDVRAVPPTGSDGVFGKAGVPTKDRRTLIVSGAALSPHRPLAVSFWWAVLAPVEKNGGFGLWHLDGGRGFCSLFARSGPWCGLRDTAAVFQVYYLPGIHNVNGIFDRRVRDSLDLRPGIWHHAAIVFTAASTVAVYVDGRRVFSTRLRGREFAATDRLNRMTFGSGHGTPVALDDVMVLNRPLTGAEVADYVRGVRQMRTAGNVNPPAP